MSEGGNAPPRPRGRKPLSKEEKNARQAPCDICGDSSSGYHYGVRSCEGCKAFFKRTVQMGRIHECNGNRTCVVDKPNRNQCQACRWRKCLHLGMKIDLVRQDRAPGNRPRQPSNSSSIGNLAQSSDQEAYFKGNSSISTGGESYSSSSYGDCADLNVNPGTNRMIDTSNSIATSFPTHNSHFCSCGSNYVCGSSNTVCPSNCSSCDPIPVYDPSMPALDLESATFLNALHILNPDMGFHSSTFMNVVNEEDYMNATFQEVEQIIEFVQKIPGFMDLCVDDRNLLLTNSFLGIQLLRLACRRITYLVRFFRRYSSQFQCSIEEKSALNRYRHIPNVMAMESPLSVSGFPREILDYFQSVFNECRILHVDHMECAILQVLLLANDTLELLNEPGLVRNLEKEALCALTAYNDAFSPCAPLRPGCMLRMLESVQRLARACALSFLERVQIGQLRQCAATSRCLDECQTFVSSSCHCMGSVLTHYLDSLRTSF